MTAEQWQIILSAIAALFEGLGIALAAGGGFYAGRTFARCVVEWWRDEYIDWD